ncbi:MAG: hypothetical protein ACXVA9_04950 [Bdellovibrionales bacterium]
MSCLKKPISKILLLLWISAVLGCGVKGDPLPPEKPADIGRGRPTYKRATEEIKIQKTPSRNSAPAKEDTDEDDDERE